MANSIGYFATYLSTRKDERLFFAGEWSISALPEVFLQLAHNPQMTSSMDVELYQDTTKHLRGGSLRKIPRIRFFGYLLADA